MQGKQTLLHGDTHVDNTYITDTGMGGLIDFQLLVKGNPMIDVSYYLVTTLDTEVRQLQQRSLMILFAGTKQQGVRDVPDLDCAWQDYCGGYGIGYRLVDYANDKLW